MNLKESLTYNWSQTKRTMNYNKYKLLSSLSDFILVIIDS